MGSGMKRYYLGVDIGGSKSHALVADEVGRALGFGEFGAGNHEVVGYDGLQAALKAVTGQALHMAGLSVEQISGAGFGVAGYDWPSERAPTLEAIVNLGLSCPLEAVNDAIIGLLAGARQGWGVAVVGGTGCNCWGWDRQRRTGRVTGCGGWAGEYGGGADIVRKAMQAIAYAWTRRGPETSLTQAFITSSGAAGIEDLLEGLVLGRYVMKAEHALLVIGAAYNGDQAARQIVEWAGRELGALAVSVIRQLDFQPLEFDLVLVGSLFDAGPLLLEPMQQVVHAEAPGARFVRLSAPPVVGGVLLGMEAAGLEASLHRERLVETTLALIGKNENSKKEREIP